MRRVESTKKSVLYSDMPQACLQSETCDSNFRHTTSLLAVGIQSSHLSETQLTSLTGV